MAFQKIKEYVAEQKAAISAQLDMAKCKLSLLIIQVGHNPASDIYVRNKQKDAEEVGIKCEIANFEETVTQDELLNFIQACNTSPSITGFIVQLPLPAHISEEAIKLAISPDKDVDGFHPLSKTVPATPLGIYKYLKAMQFNFDGKNAVILGRSNIVGKPMHQLLLKENMNAIMLHTHTSESDKKYYLQRADLIVVATGHRNTLTADYKLKKSAVVIDVGINRNEEGKVCGDCAKDLPVKFQSPVPGGCGLMTRLAVIENLLSLYKEPKNEN